MQQQKKRIEYVDVLKCIAMIMVVIYHLNKINDDFISDGVYILNYFLKSILSVSVPIFFFVNGYLLFDKNLNIKSHIKKTIKIILQTILWGIITHAYFIVLRNDAFDLRYIRDSILNPKEPIIHLWYIGALICIYWIYPLLKSAYDNNKKVFIVILIIFIVFSFGNKLLSMLLTVYNYMVGNNTVAYGNFFGVYNPLRGINGFAIGYFCIGGFCRDFKSRIIKLKSKKNNFIAVMIIIVMMLLQTSYGVFITNMTGVRHDIVSNEWDSFYTVINVLMIYFLSLSYSPKENGWGYKVVRLISVNSFGIYVMHMLLIFLVNPLIKVYNIWMNLPVIIICGFVITLICAVVSAGIRKINIFKELL